MKPVQNKRLKASRPTNNKMQEYPEFEPWENKSLSNTQPTKRMKYKSLISLLVPVIVVVAAIATTQALFPIMVRFSMNTTPSG
jgi:hypothetical protein